jgi:hypothetical protein
VEIRPDPSPAIGTAFAASDLEILCAPTNARDKLPSVTESALPSLLDGLRPYLPLVVLLVVLVALLSLPLPGRGPRILQRRDPWRGFKFAARRAVMTRAAGRCEAPRFFTWGRYPDPATEADHVFPWSCGGPTVVSNGQALCGSHNRRKSSLRPPWWYVLSLERRRASYVPSGVELRVLARMNADERLARETWMVRRSR